VASSYPFKTDVTELKVNDSTNPGFGKFKVFCKAGETGYLDAACDSVLVRINQRIGRGGAQEMWESVQVTCREQENGSLAVEVVVFHPDWDEPLRIASMLSTPCNLSPVAEVLRCDLEPKQV
jgi:hypothetical protein